MDDAYDSPADTAPHRRDLSNAVFPVAPRQPARFLFVDRITTITAGHIEGWFAVPADLPHLPAALVAEAVGQLAAWAAMRQSNFSRRPVAALVGAARPSLMPPGGTRLVLSAEIESSDEQTVVYRGAAHVDGCRVLELEGCVGAMMPMEEFDDPDAMRSRFEGLCDPAAVLARAQRDATTAPSREVMGVSVIECEPGASVRAQLAVPHAASYFADHFPRRHVFPGTLLLDAQVRLAQALQQRPLDTEAPAVHCVHDVKMRSFIVPGQIVELRAEVLSTTAKTAEVALAALAEGRRVATASVALEAAP